MANEQEVLLALSDVAILIYALESAVLRAEKASASAGVSRKGLLQAVVELCAFDAVTKLTVAAQRGAAYVSEGEELARLHKRIHELSTYDASGLLQSKRALADAVRETERYPL